MKQQRTALVITSIAGPNPVLKAFAKGCQRHGIGFILIGDVPSPSDFELPGCDFWSLERQRTMPFELAQLLPERHYGRKNLGYLQAMANGARVIIESDDDNFPREGFWAPRQLEHQAEHLIGTGWVNVYRKFSNTNIWPRGFALEHLQAPPPPKGGSTQVECAIQQGLADEDPDVDAIYRLTGTLPLEFDQRTPVAIGKGCWCPFNSQNTTWFAQAFPLLYLPSYCSFRMTDIWRSFVALRVGWENGMDLLFHAPTVWQERNTHDLLKDFADETIGYLNNGKICRRLEQLSLKGGMANIGQDMLACYAEFVDMDLIGKAEMPLIEAWLRDQERLSPPIT